VEVAVLLAGVGFEELDESVAEGCAVVHGHLPWPSERRSCAPRQGKYPGRGRFGKSASYGKSAKPQGRVWRVLGVSRSCNHPTTYFRPGLGSRMVRCPCSVHSCRTSRFVPSYHRSTSTLPLRR